MVERRNKRLIIKTSRGRPHRAGWYLASGPQANYTEFFDGRLPFTKFIASTMSLRLGYVPHIVYSLALTSISMHLLYQRRAAQEDRSRLSAKISILESLLQRLDEGERISPGELERQQKLAGLLDSHSSESRDTDTKIGWKDVLLGRKEQHARRGGWDQKDWEKGRSDSSNSFDIDDLCLTAPQWNTNSGHLGDVV